MISGAAAVNCNPVVTDSFSGTSGRQANCFSLSARGSGSCPSLTFGGELSLSHSERKKISVPLPKEKTIPVMHLHHQSTLNQRQIDLIFFLKSLQEHCYVFKREG